MSDNTPELEEEEPSNILRGDVMNVGGVADSLVIDTTALGEREEGALLCFLVLDDGVGCELGEVGLGVRQGCELEVAFDDR